MADETKWVTYDELAAALGIAPDSARRLVARKRWPRQTGNDGRARIEVPVERLTPDKIPDIPQDMPPDVDPDDGDDVSPDVSPVVLAMTRHLEHVEKHLEEVKAERDAERVRSATLTERLAEIEVARAALEGQAATLRDVLSDRDVEFSHERDRVVDVTAQLLMATAQATEAVEVQADLRSRLEATVTELQALRSRPWWRRLAG